MSESLVFTKEGAKYHYNRSCSGESNRLDSALKNRYGSKECVVTPSGMAAISSVLNVLCSSLTYRKVNLVYSSELYSDSPRLFDRLSNIYPGKVILHQFDILKPLLLLDLFKTFDLDSTTILFAESCSNPNSYMFDFSIIPELRKFNFILHVVIDNTWLSSVIFNPFDHGADFVVTSLTKYYSGGEAIGGAVFGNNHWMKEVFDWISVNGFHSSPHNCKIIADGVTDIDHRIKKSSGITVDVVNGLRSNPNIKEINHPSVETHSSHQIYKTLVGSDLYPSVFTIGVTTSKNKALKFMQESNVIEHKTSFGGVSTRTDPWPKPSNGLIYCRIAIGYDELYGTNDTIEAINQMVNKMVGK